MSTRIKSKLIVILNAASGDLLEWEIEENKNCQNRNQKIYAILGDPRKYILKEYKRG